LCRGELREVEARYRLDLTEAEYFDIIRDKTASLIGGCCEAGALLGGCPPDTAARLKAFGLSFGLAFQIIDDCLDLIGDPARLGKAVYADLDKGVLSLPMIYLAQALSVRERNRLFAPLRLPALPAPRRAAARQAGAPPVHRKSAAPAAGSLIRIAKAAQAAGAITQAEARARMLIHEAETALAQAPANGLAPAYHQLAVYALARRS
jgi:octaprenyl-diphosphate synthase